MNQDLSDTEDYEATSEILSGSMVFEDTSDSLAFNSPKVLPPIVSLFINYGGQGSRNLIITFCNF